MSAKNRAGSSSPDLDVCPTPPALARTCLRLLDIRPGMKVLEPSAADGRWLRELRALHGPNFHAHALELRKSMADTLVEGVSPFKAWDVTTGVRYQDFMSRPRGGFDLVVGNPPYTFASDFIRHSMFMLGDGGILAFLLRLPFRVPKARRALFKQFPVWRYYAPEDRPSFDGDGTDATEYALFVQRKNRPRDDDGILRTFAWCPERRESSVIEADVAEIRRLDIRVAA